MGNIDTADQGFFVGSPTGQRAVMAYLADERRRSCTNGKRDGEGRLLRRLESSSSQSQ
jgi:hypothetical protein